VKEKKKNGREEKSILKKGIIGEDEEQGDDNL
jgi:hypothetical protein